MKKNYLTPVLSAVNVAAHGHILDGGSPVHTFNNNAEMNYGGGSTNAARVKQDDYNVWNDDWNK